MHVLAKFRTYLVGGKFIVKKNHNSLKYFLNKKELNDRQQKWVSRLQEYNFEIVYVKGKINIIVDALSRRPHLFSLVEIDDDWRELNVANYAKDSWATGIIEGTTQDYRYTVSNELIMYKGGIYLVPNSRLKEKALRYFHDVPMFGHPGFFKTYR